MHTIPLAQYMDRIYAGDWVGSGELILRSARKLAGSGAPVFPRSHREFERWRLRRSRAVMHRDSAAHQRAGLIATDPRFDATPRARRFARSRKEVACSVAPGLPVLRSLTQDGRMGRAGLELRKHLQMPARSSLTSPPKEGS